MIARLVENFDYLGFFRAAKRALALRALNDVGGIAMETENEWRNDEGLAFVAATVARGARWLPEFFRAPVEHRNVDEMCEAEWGGGQ